MISAIATFATPARTGGRSHRPSSSVAQLTILAQRVRCRSATPRRAVTSSSIQGRQILIVASSSQLLTLQYLVGLANLQFWAERFPAKKEGATVSPWDAGQILMEECRRMGPFDPRRVRGRGVWLEGDRVIVNLGDPLPTDVRHLYLCFEPLPLRSVKTFDTLRLQKNARALRLAESSRRHAVARLARHRAGLRRPHLAAALLHLRSAQLRQVDDSRDRQQPACGRSACPPTGRAVRPEFAR